MIKKYSNTTSFSDDKTATVGDVAVSEPNADGERETDGGIILPSSVDVDKEGEVETLLDRSTGERTTRSGIILNGNLDEELRNRH